jgi:hypothetical protein
MCLATAGLTIRKHTSVIARDEVCHHIVTHFLEHGEVVRKSGKNVVVGKFGIATAAAVVVVIVVA